MITTAPMPNDGKRHIDLKGPEGNAFVLIGIAKCYAYQLDKNGKAIADEMVNSDYENLLAVFDREFGEFVVLHR